MKKQKIKIMLLIFAIMFVCSTFGNHVLANGGATVSWVAPTTNEDDSTPLDLAGYTIYYGTAAISCTSWDAASDQATRQAITLASNHVDVAEAATLRDSGDATKRGYTFSTTSYLTPGQTYYFTVVAYDSSGNYSKCVNDSGNNKTASKLIYHSGNINNLGTVDISDLSILAGDFGRTSWCRIASHPSDINGDCSVDISDLSILAGEFGQ